MKKNILFIAFLLASVVSFAQFPNYTNINGRYKWIAGKFDSTFTLPVGTTPSLRTGGGNAPGAIFYSTTDSTVYQYTGTQWTRLRGTDTAHVVSAYVRNTTASTMTAGQVVYINGSTGTTPTIALAVNTADSTSAMTFGFVRGTIPPNGFGWITTFGPLEGVNTNAYTEGEVIYLDSIPGQFTHFKPQAPYHMVTLGYIVKKSGGNGTIFAKIQNGYELEELHNVRITSPVRNNAILSYDSVAHLWKDTTLNAIGGITGTGTTNYIPKFTSSSAIGNSNIYEGASGKIGINTITTNERLTIYDQFDAITLYQTAATGTGSQDGLYVGYAGNEAYFWNFENTPIWFGTNNTERMRLDASGNLGLGTSSPAARLSIKTTGAQVDVSTSATDVIFESIDRGATTNPISTKYYTRNGDFQWYNSSYTERMRLDASGNLGLGTSSPAAKLDVNDGTNLNFRVKQLTLDNFSNDGIGTIFTRTSDGAELMAIGVADSDKLGMFSREGLIFATGGASFYSPTIERMRITSGGNVGIGTTSPSQLLQVAGVETLSTKINAVGTLYGSGNYLNAFSSAGGNDVGFAGFIASQNNNTTNRLWMGVHIPSGANQAFVGTPDSTPLAFWTNSTERMRITSGGNVGIGTTSPTEKLQVVGAIVASNQITNTDVIRANTNNANGTARIGTYFNNALIAQFVNDIKSASSTEYGYMQASDGTNYIAGSKTVFEYGNVGIGTTSPAYKLEVNNAARIGNSSGGVLISGDGGSGNIWTDIASPLRLGANNAEYMRITSGGDVGIGTTSPNSLLHINSATSPYIRLQTTNGSGKTWGIGVDNAYSNGINFSEIGVADGRLFIASGGNVGIGTTAPQAKIHALLNGNVSGGPTGTVAIFQNSSVSNNAYISLFGAFNSESGIIFTDESQAYRGKIAYNNDTEFMYFQTDGSERMRITSGGLVGIGNSNPQDFSGDANTLVLGSTSNSLAGMTIANDATGTGGIYFADGTDGTNKEYRGFFSYFHGTDELVIGAGGAGRLNITSTETNVFSGNFVVDTNTLFVDAANNRVGIGTTNPLSLFHINGSTSGAVQAYIQNSNGGTNSSAELVFGTWSGAIPTGSGNPGPSAKIVALNTNNNNAATDLIFHTYSASGTSAERMRITSSGELLINTTSDAGDYKLQVNGSTYVSGSLLTMSVGDIWIQSGGQGILSPNASRLITINDGAVDIAGSLKIGGNFTTPISIKTGNYTLGASDYTVVFDISANTTATLPDATTCTGRIYTIKANVSNTSTLTIDGNGSQTIDGNTTYDLQCKGVVIIQSDGSNWRILATYQDGTCL